jgi:hypothetical protein
LRCGWEFSVVGFRGNLHRCQLETFCVLLRLPPSTTVSLSSLCSGQDGRNLISTTNTPPGWQELHLYGLRPAAPGTHAAAPTHLRPLLMLAQRGRPRIQLVEPTRPCRSTRANASTYARPRTPTSARGKKFPARLQSICWMFSYRFVGLAGGDGYILVDFRVRGGKKLKEKNQRFDSGN